MRQLCAAIEDLEGLQDCHPGLVTALLTTCKQLRRGGKDSSRAVAAASAVKRKYATYGSDPRRPKRPALRTWKSFVGDPASSAPAGGDRCYMCKSPGPDDLPLCSSCLERNRKMKELPMDLSGRYAVVTGARIKIGLEVALRMLRSGCFVVATTRFPRSALLR